MLRQKLDSIAADDRLNQLRQTLTIVDGTIVEALPRIAQAAFRSAQSGSSNKLKWTLHTHFEVARHPATRRIHPERRILRQALGLPDTPLNRP
jgi:hypothetical protein